MCGLAGIVGTGWEPRGLEAMIDAQKHRGPDATGRFLSDEGLAGLGHNRLSIIDLSEAGIQPMNDTTGRLSIVLNGEIYNYLELRAELERDYRFRSRTDTEVLMAAYLKWGDRCLDRLIGMFSFAIWDSINRTLFVARDRFGVKPLYYHVTADGTLYFASEIKALHRAGVPAEPDVETWATYLSTGLTDSSEKTFWRGISSLGPGHLLTWRNGRTETSCWYDLGERARRDYDQRPVEEVAEEYRGLLIDSVRLRFRADVPVGINLSGGVDSSTLLGIVQQVEGEASEVKAFTFETGDPNYDETPWVRQMLARTRHPSIVSMLSPGEVPALAASVQYHQDEPFGGLPTLAYAKLFESARAEGVIVLLDGQGLDEQWAGYDYYRDRPSNQEALVQGVSSRTVRPECLIPEFRVLSAKFESPSLFEDRLRNLQYRDARFTKIPRALRFSDRVSMRSSTELREPFLDHRLFELALSQPPERKINNGTSKWLLRKIAASMLPRGVVEAPKRPLQTPQREWLRGPLKEWATHRIETAIRHFGGEWLDSPAVRREWDSYCMGANDNSFFVWQWISLGLILETTGDARYLAA